MGHKEQRNKLCSRAVTSHKKHIKKGREGKPKRAISLEEP